ncbi:hypothetical protein KXJ81_35125, partial [Ensifer adhaerens]|nr:hypothetical protein [Ensifer adhaerens]
NHGRASEATRDRMTARRVCSLFGDAQELAEVLGGSNVRPARDAAGNQPQVGLGHKRRDRLFLHQHRFGFKHQLRASGRIQIDVGLLHQAV